MRKTELNRLRKVLETQLHTIDEKSVLREDMTINSDERADEVDQANNDTVQGFSMRLRNRETLLKKRIQSTLMRMDKGEYGICEICEEPIEVKRLFARPIATQCIACKEDEEAKEGFSSAVRHHKSLGETFTRVQA